MTITANTVVSVPLTVAQVDVLVAALGDALRQEALCADRNPLDRANGLLPIATAAYQAVARAREDAVRNAIAESPRPEPEIANVGRQGRTAECKSEADA